MASPPTYDQLWEFVKGTAEQPDVDRNFPYENGDALQDLIDEARTLMDGSK